VRARFASFLQLKEVVEIIPAFCRFSTARAQHEFADVLRFWPLFWGGATGELFGPPHDCSARAAPQQGL